MRKLLDLSMILFLAFSSIFFIDSQLAGTSFSTMEKVEAKVCPPGQYPNYGVDGMTKTGGACKGDETIKSSDNEQTMENALHEFVQIYNIVAGVLLAISIIAILVVAYIYISPFETTKLNGGGGRAMNVQDNTKAKMYLISIGLGIVLILSGFTIMRLVVSIVGL